MLGAFFEDILKILEAFDNAATETPQLRTGYFQARANTMPQIFSETKKLATAVASTRNPMNVLMFGPGAETRWFHRPRAIVSFRDEKCLGLIFGKRKNALASLRKLGACTGKDVCILDTNGDHIRFHYFEASSEESRVILEMDTEELVQQLNRVGTLWEMVFPREHAIVCRTISYTVPKDFCSVLFSTMSRTEFLLDRITGWIGVRSSIEKRALRRLSSAFSSQTKIFEAVRNQSSLDSLYLDHADSSEINSPFTDLQKRFEASGLSTYDATATVPSCMNFSIDSEVGTSTREDRVHAYIENGEVFFRDFVLTQADTASYDDAKHVEDTLSHIMAFRRSGLFRSDFAKKIYNITLPGLLLKNRGAEGQDLIVLPHMILYRTPIFSSFRRTFSLSYVCLPVSINANANPEKTLVLSRKATLDEIHAINSSLRKPHDLSAAGNQSESGYEINSRLSEMLELPQTVDELRDVVGAVSIGVLEWINKRGSGRFFSKKAVKSSDRVSEIAYISSLESEFSTLLHLVEWKSKPEESRPWEEWLKSNEDESIRDAVYKRLFFSDFMDPSSAYTTKESVKLEEMLVGNRLRTDMTGMTFLDPSNDSKLIIYPVERENFPNYSILRWLGFSIYQDSAVACLQEMIREFNREIDQADDTLAVLSGLEGMLQNFGELYDLDIRYSLYRDEYENVRALTNLDQDYQRLRERFDSVKEQAILREQRLFNKLLLSLAVVTIFFGIIQYTGTKLGWSSTTFAFATAIPLLSVAVIIFKLFDPIRAFLKGSRGDG